MDLPQPFESKMISLLGEEEYALYKETFDQSRVYGLRANTLKISPEELKNLFDQTGDVKIDSFVPWCKDGMYYTEGYPGRLPFYHAGLYYIQEPSAMYPAEVLAPKPGENVLDICAAPGGKTVKLCALMKGQGLLVSNDINAERAKALVKNIEMCGITNAIVTNASGKELEKNFGKFFDKILVDAPCSGEGMFRKDPTAIEAWEEYKTNVCREMQDQILEEVHPMLKEGGILLYSTCTFDINENESTIADFMARHPEYKLLPLPKSGGIAPGYDHKALEGDKVSRLWPHKLRGEGHFTAMLIKDPEHSLVNETKQKPISKCKSYKLLTEAPVELIEFYKKSMNTPLPEGNYITMEAGGGLNVFYCPFPTPNVDMLKVLRMGLFLGQIIHKKFKPSHAFAIAQQNDAFKNNIDLKYGSDPLERYLKGETLFTDPSNSSKGICAVRLEIEGHRPYILGLGQIENGIIKNLYPKGWRRLS